MLFTQINDYGKNNTKPRYIVWGYAEAQLIEALCYKLKGRGFDSRWCQWNFSLT
jgi:hypothetical protein